MERSYSDGQAIKYVDAQGRVHDALITRWWAWKGKEFPPGPSPYSPPDAEYLAAHGEPGCNVVYVTADPSKTDPYGFQIERSTSVIHKSKQPAPGNFWCWADELK